MVDEAFFESYSALSFRMFMSSTKNWQDLRYIQNYSKRPIFTRDHLNMSSEISHDRFLSQPSHNSRSHKIVKFPPNTKTAYLLV
jgi:hypothetical protein